MTSNSSNRNRMIRNTAEKMAFSIKDFLDKCDQICSGHIYLKNSKWKASFFVQCNILYLVTESPYKAHKYKGFN